MDKKYIAVTLVQTEVDGNPVLDNILNSVNTYLIRNKGAVSDFNLIKDIVDRNVDAIDEEVNNQIPIPLYLGLMGTMLGIVAGLGYMVISGFDSFFNFSLDGNSDSSRNGIEILLGGVGLAMIASFIGLFFTTINSGFYYKGAKSSVEESKNEFFSFIQTELLPILSQNVTSSIYSLQSNLLNFNDKFEDNIQNFNKLLGGILESFNSQVDLMKELKSIDVVQLAKLNVNVLSELRTSSRQFEKFNTYLTQVNSFVENATHLNYQINNQIQRTNEIGEIANSIYSNVNLNKQLLEVLSSEIREVESRKKIISDSVAIVDDTIQKSLDELKYHTQAKMEAIKNITIKEEDLLEKLLKEDRGNLDELKKLGSLNNGIEKLRESSEKQNVKLDNLNSAIKTLNEVLTLSAKTEKNNDIVVPKPLKLLIYSSLIIGSGIGIYFIAGRLVIWVPKIIEYLF